MNRRLWLAPEPGAGPLLVHGGGSGSYALAIPANPVLAGLRIAVQALVLDTTAPNGVGAVTNAGVATLY